VIIRGCSVEQYVRVIWYAGFETFSTAICFCLRRLFSYVWNKTEIKQNGQSFCFRFTSVLFRFCVTCKCRRDFPIRIQPLAATASDGNDHLQHGRLRPVGQIGSTNEKHWRLISLTWPFGRRVNKNILFSKAWTTVVVNTSPEPGVGKTDANRPADFDIFDLSPFT